LFLSKKNKDFSSQIANRFLLKKRRIKEEKKREREREREGGRG